MLFLILFALVLVAAVVVLWPEPDAGGLRTDHKETGGDGGGAVAAPTTLEGALVAQLVGGQISRAQYRTAVARLAERDAERNPLSVPGEDRPDAWT